MTISSAKLQAGNKALNVILHKRGMRLAMGVKVLFAPLTQADNYVEKILSLYGQCIFFMRAAV